MKKSTKKLCSIALLLTSTTAIAGVNAIVTNNTQNPNTTIFAEQNASNVTRFEIEGYKQTATVGSLFTIPSATFITGGASTSITSSNITVTGPFCESVSVSEGKFKVERIGDYTISYANGEYSTSITVKADKGITTLKLTDNTSKILPNKVWKSFSGDLFIPEATVEFENDENQVEYSISTSVTSPSHQNITFDETTRKLNIASLEEGFYDVVYTATSNNGVYLCTTKTSFEVLADSQYSSTYDLKFDYSSTLPTAADIGETISLPIPTGKRSTDNEQVPVYYTIEAYTYIEGELVNQSNETFKDKKVIEGNKFTANKEGTWVFYYNVKDALGKTAERNGFTITGVKDTEKPTIVIANPYDITQTSNIKDVSTELQKYTEGGKNIVVKAIFATDYADSLADMKLSRTVQADNQSSVTGKKYSDEDTGNTSNFNKNIIFNLDETAGFVFDDETMIDGGDLEDGSYTVYYKAIDKSGNTQTVSYSFTVKSDFQFLEAPTVEFQDTFETSIASGEIISFSAPIASDDYDDRLKTIVQYRYDNDALDTWTTLEIDEDTNLYSVKVEKAGANKIIIQAKTENDAPVGSLYKYGYSTKEITITDNNDVYASVFVSLSDVEATYYQNQEITVPTITLMDDLVDYLDVNVSVKNVETGIVSSVYDCVKTRALDTLTMSAKFYASLSGEYEIVYTSRDAANNTIVAYQSINVIEQAIVEEPRFVNLPEALSSGSMELGETITLPVPEIRCTAGRDSEYRINVKGSANHTTVGGKFKPNEVGDYTIIYTLYVENDLGDLEEIQEAEKQFKISVKDTVAPTIGVDWNLKASYDINSNVLIPVFTASDLSGINMETSKIVVSSKSFTRTIYYKNMASELVKYQEHLEDSTKPVGSLFIPLSYNEEYKVTYTAFDKSSSNSKTETYSFKVGDLVAPVLDIEDNIIESNIKIDSVLSIDTSKIAVSDSKTTDISVEDIEIVVKNTTTGKIIENIHEDEDNGKFEYNITTAGDYSVSFKVEDDAKNPAEITRTFTVNDVTNSGIDSTEVIGTVLIVVSVLVLAGVIVYFIVSKKKIDKMYK